MDIDFECEQALSRVNSGIEKSYKRTIEKVAYIFRGHQRITLTIRDRDHFYKVVGWCNKNIGQGRKYWTVAGRVLRFVDPSKAAYNPPAVKDWIINVPFVDCTPIIKM